MKRIIPVVLLIVGILLASFGAAGAQEDQLVFAMVSHGGAGNPFWVPAIKGMDDACALLDADCAWLSDPVNDVDTMAGYWDDALARNPDGIGTTNPMPEVIRDGVNRANEAGIPVIIFNMNDPSEPLPVLAYVGTDEVAGSASNARRIFAEAAADGVEITGGVCANAALDFPLLAARCDGAQSVFDEEGVPFENLRTTFTPAANARILADYFADNPETNAVVVWSANDAQSLNQYFRETEREPREIYATAFDTSAEIYPMIQEGYLLQTIDQQPYTQGFLTIIWLYLNSQYAMEPGRDVYTNAVIDQNNVDRVIELTEQGYR